MNNENHSQQPEQSPSVRYLSWLVLVWMVLAVLTAYVVVTDASVPLAAVLAWCGGWASSALAWTVRRRAAQR